MDLFDAILSIGLVVVLAVIVGLWLFSCYIPPKKDKKDDHKDKGGKQ